MFSLYNVENQDLLLAIFDTILLTLEFRPKRARLKSQIRSKSNL